MRIANSISGGVPERSKGADCKSAGLAFGGSNPPPSTYAARSVEVVGSQIAAANQVFISTSILRARK